MDNSYDVHFKQCQMIFHSLMEDLRIKYIGKIATCLSTGRRGQIVEIYYSPLSDEIKIKAKIFLTGSNEFLGEHMVKIISELSITDE